ncbi:hypothetical protein [Priestia megaterium]|uniref:hypothetical protein n=1 Tax=Priestia megaterium TaxID=1404 RepID=UPI002877605F|nr:hypothetical protein [Priestia megaterium]
MIKFDATVSLMDENGLYFVGVWNSEDDCFTNSELDEIVLGFTFEYESYLQLANEHNAIIENNEIYFKDKADAEAVKTKLNRMLGSHHQSLEGIVYEVA